MKVKKYCGKEIEEHKSATSIFFMPEKAKKYNLN